MRSSFPTLVLLALCACSSPSDPTSQASSGVEVSGANGGSTGSDPAGSSGTSGAPSGSATSGTGSAGSGTGTTGSSAGATTTGHPSGSTSGGAISGGASQTGTSGSATESGSSGKSASGSSGSAKSGTSSGAIEDAGAMHRDAAPVVLTGCAAQVPQTVFAASCEGSNCHSAATHQYDLDLQSPGVASRLVNQPSLEALQPDGVTPYKLIDPNNPMQSYILLKVELKQPPAGAQMPNLGAMISPSLITCLQDWVVAEAAGPY